MSSYTGWDHPVKASGAALDAWSKVCGLRRRWLGLEPDWMLRARMLRAIGWVMPALAPPRPVFRVWRFEVWYQRRG